MLSIDRAQTFTLDEVREKVSGSAVMSRRAAAASPPHSPKSATESFVRVHFPDSSMRVFAIDNERTTAAELLQMARKKYGGSVADASRFVIMESVNVIEERALDERELVGALTSRWVGNSRRLLYKDRSQGPPPFSRETIRVLLAGMPRHTHLHTHARTLKLIPGWETAAGCCICGQEIPS